MIEEQIFATEISLPEEFESILNVSIKHDKLVEVMKFVMNTLQRHEKGIKGIFDRTKWVAPEVKTLMREMEANSKFIVESEKNSREFTEDLKTIKEMLLSKHNTEETLKFVLEMITTHDSAIISRQQELEELKQAYKYHTEKISEFEKKFSEIEDKFEKHVESQSTREINKKGRVIQINTEIGETSPENIKSISSQKSVSNNRKNASLNADDKAEVKPEEKNEETTDVKRVEFEVKKRIEEGKAWNDLPHSENMFEKSPHFSTKPGFFEAVFPYPNKGYSEIEKTISTPSEHHFESKSILKTQMVLPSQVKALEKRIDTVEKILISTETQGIYNRLEFFDNVLKKFEKILEKLQPDVARNKASLLKISKKVTDVEKDLLNKINSSHFDAVKALVIAIASGSSKKDLPINTLSAQDLNHIENINKRLLELESFYIENKIAGVNLDEFSYKLHQIEQRIDFKAEANDIEKLRHSVTTLSDQHKLLFSELDIKERKSLINALKPSDSALLSSLNRKIISYEETMKALKLPNGTSIHSILEEVQKLWDSLKFIMNTIESFSEKTDEKISQINEKLLSLNIEKLIKAREVDLKAHVREISEVFEKKFADKFEMLRGFKYVESALDRLEKWLKKPEGDDAMLAKRPLKGWACGSCDKNLEKVTGKILYKPWNKLPERDPKERISKAGPAFSKMLLTGTLDTSKTRRLYNDELILPSIPNTDRSATPQPIFD